MVTVITTSLNVVNYIGSTIKSVLSQSYPHIEYIIIDGGSIDGTAEIIRNYAASLAYWQSKPDRGIAHAFNEGLAHATGQWILYLGADDFFLGSSVVEKMVPHLRNKECDVVYGRIIRMTREKSPNPAPLCKIGGKPWRWQEFRRENTIPHQAAFTSRSFFQSVGNFDESFRIAMDYELYLRGGKDLNAQFVPVEVAGMRSGGQCGKSPIQTFQEFKRAQIMHRALPRGLAWVNFLFIIARVYLGKAAHKVLDPFAHKIHLAGRNPIKLS